jgi:uncharacterized radical SAM superfamily Fe-S cluster-containing enzyme
MGSFYGYIGFLSVSSILSITRFVNWLQESDIHYIISHFHQGTKKFWFKRYSTIFRNSKIVRPYRISFLRTTDVPNIHPK